MRDLLVTIIVFGAIPWMLSKPYIGIYVWYWLGLMNAPQACFGFAQSFPFAQVTAIVTLGSILITKDKKSVPWDTGLVLLVLLYIHMALTSSTAWVPDNAWSKWVDFGKIVLVTIVMTTVIYGRERIRMLVLVATLSVGFYGFKGGIFSILTGGSHRVWGPPGNTFISGNNEIGLALGMVIPMLIALGKEENRRWLSILLYSTAFLSSIATLFTYSRGALLGLAVTLSLTFLKSRKKYLLIPFLIPLAIFGKSLLPEQLMQRTETIGRYEQDKSAMQRVLAWKVSWRIAMERPLVGAGFEFESPDTEPRWLSYTDPEDAWLGNKMYVAHSIYFQALGQHGLLGLALFMGILTSSLRSTRSIHRTAKEYPETQWIASYTAAIHVGLISFMVSGAFLNLAWFDLIWLYVGLLAVLKRELQAVSFSVPITAADNQKLSSFVKPLSRQVSQAARLTNHP
jgi:probable O-glycosylation ligase (exosortase A-associated)